MLCSINKLSKMFGGHSVFTELSLEINEEERIGIVGRNGSGKTTIFKLIAGIETPDEGAIHIKKGANCGYLSQIPQFQDELTVYEVLETAFADLIKKKQEMKVMETAMAAIQDQKELEKVLQSYGLIQEQFQREGGYDIDSDIQRVSQGLGISTMHDQYFKDLSGGEKTKVGLGLILLKQPDLLLLDEPTNHLDIHALEWLEAYLKTYSGTVVVISHDRYFLDEIVTKIYEIEEGECQVYHGNYSYYVKEKEERLLAEFAAYQEQQKKIKKMKETIKRLKEWANQANPPNEGLHKRAKSMEKALERMEKIKRPLIDQRKMGLDFSIGERSGQDVVVLDKVAYGYDQHHPLFLDIDLKVRYKERIAIVGNNGTGKSTLLKLITGECQPLKGKVQLGSQVHIGYLSQHVFSYKSDERVIDVFREEVPVAEGEARHILAKFLFYGFAVFRKVRDLSGGERMRLRLAQLMHQKINVLILDEPTNHLDIDSREVLEEAVEQFEGTIITVSHDRYFLNKCFDTTYWLFNQTLVRFEGNYHRAKLKKEALFPDHKEEADLNKTRANPVSLINKRANHMDDRLNAVSEIEMSIQDLEAELLGIDQNMIHEESLEVLKDLQLKKEHIEKERDVLYSRWEEIMED